MNLMKQQYRLAGLGIALIELAGLVFFCGVFLGFAYGSSTTEAFDSALAMAIGGIIFVLPSAYFSHYAFRYQCEVKASHGTSVVRANVSPQHDSWNDDEYDDDWQASHPIPEADIQAAASMTRSFYKGEVGKFSLTLVGFALVFRFLPDIDALALFGAFGFMTVAHWFIASWAIKRLGKARVQKAS